MFTKNHYPRKKNSASVPRSRWLACVVAGQLLGFAVAVAVAGPVVSVAALVSTLAGGVLGGLAGTRLKQQGSSVKDKDIRAHVFRALEVTGQKLDQIIRENFNETASTGGEKDRFARKAELALKPPAPPAPPKFGGM